jgi:tetratricopeptide (TPR) repeat protein
MLLTAAAWIGWNSNAWQTWLIKRDLRGYGSSLNDNKALSAIAQAFVYAGDSPHALQALDRIQGDINKTNALSAVAQSYTKLGDKERASALLAEAAKTAGLISDDDSKAFALGDIALSYAKLAESSNDGALYTQTFRFIEGLGSDDARENVLQSILSSGLTVADVGRLRALTSHFSSEAGKANALAQILIAVSHPELIGQEKEAEDDDE